jgi:heme-degrading monooxygenase HmoA
MIARLWSAQTTPEKAPAYVEHLRSHVLPALKRLDGFGGAMLLQRPVPDGVDILVLTYWQSVEVIGAFAGADLEQAVVAAEAAAVLTKFDPRVRHYEVVVREDA